MYELFSKKGEPDVKELATIVDNILSSRSSYGTFPNGLVMAINLGFLPNHRLMKQQLRTPLLKKLEILERGKFVDYASIYNRAILQLKYYLYNIHSLPHDGNRIPSFKERLKQLDFMLDFSLVTGLSEYPLTGREPDIRTGDSTAAMYLIALPYFARNIVQAWRTIHKKSEYKRELFNFLNSVEKELKGFHNEGLRSISNFSDLVTMAGKYINKKLPELREKIPEGIKMLERKNIRRIAYQLTTLIEKADNVYAVMQKSDILPSIYKAFLKTQKF